MKEGVKGRKVCSSVYISFSKNVNSVLYIHFDSQKRETEFSLLKFFFLQLVMKIHTEQRHRVSVLVGELIALGLKYRFQDLPDAVPPQRAVFSVCSLLSSCLTSL